MNVYKKTSKTCCNRAHIELRELAQILTRAMKTTKLGWDGGGGRPGRHMRVVLRDAARQGKIRGTKTVFSAEKRNQTERRTWFWHLYDGDLVTVQLLLAQHARKREDQTALPMHDAEKKTDEITDACNSEIENECSICFENLYENDGGLIHQTTPCQHTFHSLCLQLWQKQNNSCPLCRGALWILLLLYTQRVRILRTNIFIFHLCARSNRSHLD